MIKNHKLGINSKDIVRVFPEWAKVDRVVNGAKIYNMSIFDNIMTFNMNNLDGVAVDYYGTQITYRELPALRDAYARGLKMLGVKEGDVVTLCLPVGIENLMLLFAVNHLGAVSNNVNFLFLKNDFDWYTEDKNSHIVITLDAFLPYFVDHLSDSSVDKVLVMNLDDFLPEEKKGMFLDTSSLPEKMQEVFDVKQITECLMNLDKVKGVDFIPLMKVLEMGRNSDIELPSGPVDMDRDTCYIYTSGTTGRPKCVVYKEFTDNAYLEMHAGLDTQDYVGERYFQLIPMSHTTGIRVTAYNPMARGGTLVPQPIYNKNAFAKDLSETHSNNVVATASFYLSAVKGGILGPKALKHLIRPASGGEPITKSGVKQVNEWLKANGCNVAFSLGGGASEEGGATLVTYFMDENRTNETGKPLEPWVRIKLVDDEGNLITEPGVYGNMHATSPAAADRYLGLPEATAARWYVDEEGTRWGVTGDIAVMNKDGSYNILGRASDSYVDENDIRHYLFDKEYSLDPTDPILEWEITAFEVENGRHEVVGQIVLREDCEETKSEIVRRICKKYNLDAVKFYDEFELGEITSKRDFLLLQHDYEGYYAPLSAHHVYAVDYSEDKTVTRTRIRSSVLDKDSGSTSVA